LFRRLRDLAGGSAAEFPSFYDHPSRLVEDFVKDLPTTGARRLQFALVVHRQLHMTAVAAVWHLQGKSFQKSKGELGTDG
jgi:hypothetical protein